MALPRSPATPKADPDTTGAWLLPDASPEERPDIAADGIKAAFVILVGPNTTEELAETLENLHQHVLAHRPRPVLLFVPGDVPAGDAATLRTRLPRAVAAVVKLVPLPDFTHMSPEFRSLEIENVAGKRDATWVRRYPAYQNMCRRVQSLRLCCCRVYLWGLVNCTSAFARPCFRTCSRVHGTSTADLRGGDDIQQLPPCWSNTCHGAMVQPSTARLTVSFHEQILMREAPLRGGRPVLFVHGVLLP